jgi:hypothetical protein
MACALFMPIGFIYGLITAPDRKKYIWDICASIDQTGGVVCQHLFNKTLLIDPTIHPFGNEDEKISTVIGINLKQNNLTKTGWWVNRKLDKIFGTNHSINSVG